MAAPLPARCGFYVERKRRFCKMVVGIGNQFCGEHANAENGNTKRRIPCPLDPKHTVFENCLSQHLKKCNNRDKPKPVYYVEDVNAGSGDEDVLDDQIALAQRSKAELDVYLQKLKTAVKEFDLKLDESILSHPVLNQELDNPKNGDAAFKHLKQQASILGNMEALSLLGANKCFVEFGAGRGKLSHWIHEALKTYEDFHFLLVERSSTRFKVDGKNQHFTAEFERLQVDIQHLDLSKVPLLREKKIPVVGVGKHLCGAATGETWYIHHSRGSQHSFVPGNWKNWVGSSMYCELGSQTLQQAQQESLVSQNCPPPYFKVKDLALRCLLERSEVCGTSESACRRHEWTDRTAEPGGAGPDVCGLTIALCCHHRCVWRHYVGKDFFRQRGLGACEFAAFTRMSSWATCGQRPVHDVCPSHDYGSKDHDEDHKVTEESDPDSFNGVPSPEDREHIGRLCKLFIDQGRVHYLQKKGCDARLTYYTNSTVTLENVLLTAVPAVSHQTDGQTAKKCLENYTLPPTEACL
ncbi:tRNA:m(4)X modification enzyme TRM13 homolog isoform X1 [Lampris incognitus]|uniref:tRNA:m(4)X modification enzyme TRM13 homolog isoform X1 n=1 Tax=Lampris incognitus TaxID=2546036 RepID=UPI0024B618B2|nr:tRNA:m(4)X modification enzyme TRM13 homolog isoform X1 [Lampris incognitus]